MTTMTVAFGTSTPTSMTVVATRTSRSPSVKARMTRSFSSAGIRPCSAATRSPASGPFSSAGATSSTASGGRRPSGAPPLPASASGRRIGTCPGIVGASEPSSGSPGPVPPTRGQTTYAWRPRAASSRTRSHVRSTNRGLSAAGTTCVTIGDRPAGSSVSVDTSRSP